MKILVFIDHDIICRHFILSGALWPLTKAADVTFVFPDDGGRRVTLDPDTLPLHAPYRRLPIDAARHQSWRWQLFSDQLKWRAGEHEAAIRAMRWRTLGWKAATLLTLAAYAPFSVLFKHRVQARLDAHPYAALETLLDEEKPDVLFHPSVLEGVFINDLIAAGRKREIPVVVAMNSWDNPSTKRAVVGRPDHLLVWGPQTRDHAMRFMGMPPEDVTAFGVAQFDVFRDPPRLTRQAFCAANGLDPARRIILFAGSNAQTDELSVLTQLDQAIGSGHLPDCALLYRPHPWGNGGLGGERLAQARFDAIQIDHTMRAYLARVAQGQTKMSLPDYRDTHDLLCHADLVVSPLSTILLEAGLHGKPAIAFIPQTSDGGQLRASTLPMLHFSELLSQPELPVARTVDELIRIIGVPEGWPQRGAQLQAITPRFVEPFDRLWRERLVDFLHQCPRGQPNV